MKLLLSPEPRVKSYRGALSLGYDASFQVVENLVGEAREK